MTNPVTYLTYNVMCVCLQQRTGRCVSNRRFKPAMLILRGEWPEAKHRDSSARRLLRLELPGIEENQRGVVDVEKEHMKLVGVTNRVK